MSGTKVTMVDVTPDWRNVLRFMDHAIATGSVVKSKLAEFKASRDEVAAYVAAMDARCSYGCGRSASNGFTICDSCGARDEHEAMGGR